MSSASSILQVIIFDKIFSHSKDHLNLLIFLVCLKSCPGGIVQEKQCVCCNFEGYSEYSALVAQYKNFTNTIATAGQSTRNISLEIADLKTQIAQFEEFVLQNCNSVDATTVSDKLSYIRTKLIPFQMNVEKFVSKLRPTPACAGSRPCDDGWVRTDTCGCTCWDTCYKSQEKIINAPICECESLPGVSVIDKSLKKIPDYILTLTMIPGEASTELIQESKNLSSTIWVFYNDAIWRWSSTTLEEKTKAMDIVDAKARAVFAKIDSYLVTAGESCATGCELTQIQTKNCSCYYSNQFNGKLYELMDLETKIAEGIKSGKGNLTMLDELKNSSIQLRQDALMFVQLVKDGNESSVIDENLVHFTTNVTTLDTEWKAYLESLKAPACSLVCQGDKVRNTQKCACFDVESWIKLNTEVKSGLVKLRQDAESLSNDLAVKTNLLSNVKELETGIPELIKYSNLAFGLDEDYVKKRCLELVELFLKTSSEIKSASEGIATKVCDVNCPTTGNWSRAEYPTCSCDCSVTTCTEPSKFDPFKCDCVPENPNCSLTSFSCDSTQILDYTNCMCTTKP